MSCHESDHTHLISDNIISCELFEGDAAADPPAPTVIQIPIEKSISAGTEIKFTVLNIKNPTLQNYPIGISGKLLNTCENGDLNNLCTYYSSTKYI